MVYTLASFEIIILALAALYTYTYIMLPRLWLWSQIEPGFSTKALEDSEVVCQKINDSKPCILHLTLMLPLGSVFIIFFFFSLVILIDKRSSKCYPGAPCLQVFPYFHVADDTRHRELATLDHVPQIPSYQVYVRLFATNSYWWAFHNATYDAAS